MESLNRNNRFNFWFVAAASIATASLVIAVSLPQTQSLRNRGVDKLLAQAVNNPQAPALTTQAALLGWDDPAAIEAQAELYRKQGQFDLVLKTYNNPAVYINPVYVGFLALKFNQPKQAEQFFSKASKLGDSAQAQAGLALSSLAQNNISQGCNYAERAAKLDLSDPKGQAAQQVCNIFQNKSELSDRQQTYTLLNNYLYDEGETRLKNLELKTTGDYLLFAHTQASRGDINGAIESLNKGLELEPSSKELLENIIANYQKIGKGSEASQYRSRLDDVLFKKSQ